MYENKIDELKARIGTPLMANRFVVEMVNIPLPGVQTDSSDLSILCKSATLPGKSIGTQETIRHRYLPDGEVDYGNEVSFTFICDPNFLDRMIIDAWMRFIHTSDVASFTEIPQVNSQKRETQVFRFYDEFATGQVRIHVLRKDGSIAMTYQLEECYPTSMDDISLESDSAESPLEFSFTMNYKSWSNEVKPMGDARTITTPDQGNFELSGLNKGRRVFDAVLEGLKVAGRFNSKLGDLGRKLGSFDTAITRGSNISRDLGINSKYITNERRGGG